MMKRVTRALAIFWIWIVVQHHGYGQLFPGLEGPELIDSIRAHYTPSVLLNEAQVKDTLYAKVFYQAGSVHCIYSDYAHDLPPGVDPSQYLYGTGSEPGSMNLEHAWPQAKGAEQGLPGNRNMHHLFPSRSAINSTRGDNPYQDIDDAATQRWYYLDIEQSFKPATNIDAYSEFKSGAFEPREASKGDIARAMLYFWTIYHEDAVQADPLFFDEMQADLCVWQAADPVDDFEMERTQKIAQYQDGMANPFVLDCTLARRTYCSGQQDCETSLAKVVTLKTTRVEVDGLSHTLVIHDEENSTWNIRVFDVWGRAISSLELSGGSEANLDQIGVGSYFGMATSGNRYLSFKFIIL